MMTLVGLITYSVKEKESEVKRTTERDGCRKEENRHEQRDESSGSSGK